jgi:peptide/nickel transport system permease protein
MVNWNRLRRLRPGRSNSAILEAMVDPFRGDRLGQVGLIILIGFLLLGAFGPMIAPYEPDARISGEDGLKSLQEPSLEHPFGTTRLGHDVFSQTLVSARVSLIVGLVASIMSVGIGTTLALVSGYKGGWIDDAIMRLVDIVYGLPVLPFMIVLVVILGPDLFNVILAIVLVQWRQTARVVRSQVLSLKTRPYVEAAEAVGASDVRIMLRHLLPNVLPLVFLYGALSIAWAIIFEASVSFLGYGDPELYSWGKMIFAAYNSDLIREAWWWVLPPGLAIMLTVLSVFFVGRTLEDLSNPELRHAE